MAATIKIKNSSTASAVPTSSDLVQGELAVNVTDKRVFTENASGTVVELGTNPSSITLPAGSASAPTLLASGDTNTGIFFPAADTVGITTGGTERVRVDSSGRFGIGLTSMSRELQIYGSSPSVQLQNASSGTTSVDGLQIQLSGSDAYLYNYESGALIFGANNSERARIDSSGNAGFGTTTPSTQDTTGARIVSVASGTNLQAMFTDASTFTLGIKRNSTSNGGMIYGTGGSVLSLGANNTEAARIDTSGNFLVGTTGVPNGTSIYGSAFTPISFGRSRLSMASSSTASLELVQFFNPNGQVGNISTSGSSTAYTTSSDYRLKNTVQPMTGALARVTALKPVTYKWNADGSDGEGFIAHELAEVCPDAVHGEKDAVDEDGNPVYQAIDTSFLVATLTAAIQELNAKFEAYKATHP